MEKLSLPGVLTGSPRLHDDFRHPGRQCRGLQAEAQQLQDLRPVQGGPGRPKGCGPSGFVVQAEVEQERGHHLVPTFQQVEQRLQQIFHEDRQALPVGFRIVEEDRRGGGHGRHLGM